ncbi:MAG: cation transporter, partial [Deltaproteobacteria bacterium]
MGYEVVGTEMETGDALQKTTISVGGMTCAACVRRVESALKSVDGVTDAAVNLATGKAAITHNRNWAGTEALKRVVIDSGYEFLGVSEPALEDPIEAARKREVAELKVKFTVGAILSIVIFVGSMQHWFPFVRAIPRHTMLLFLFLLTT